MADDANANVCRRRVLALGDRLRSSDPRRKPLRIRCDAQLLKTRLL